MSIRDATGRDVTAASVWLPVGREFHPALRSPYHVVLTIDGAESRVVVRRATGCPNVVRIDSIEAGVGTPRPVLAALLYSALREARVAGLALAEVVAGQHEGAVRDLLRAPNDLPPGGHIRQRLDYASHLAFAGAGSELQGVLADGFPSEVVRTVEDGLYEFFSAGAWARAVRRGELSRRQYVATLIGLHSYVRYTTRLLGHCVGLSADSGLRAHYIEHLQGEINHELIIERDLANLGEDVGYVAQYHQPSAAALVFMSLQESVVGFRHDPALFLACPIAAESFAAYVQADVLDGLGQSVSSWGLARPADVTHFVRSHSGFDGGADGHWSRCVGMVGKHIRTSAQMQQFAVLVRAAVSALANHYDSCVLEYADPPETTETE